ncbi:MAG: ATPase, T2SS/T4P/T4SS family, partial [Lysobacterales bacterium]
MTPNPMRASADLAPNEFGSSGSPAGAAKPQVKLVKINGKLTVVPIQAVETAPAAEPVQTVRPVQLVESAPRSEASQFSGSADRDKSIALNYGPDVSIQNLLQQAIEQNASDLHVHSGAVLRIRVGGKFRDATTAVLSSQECERLITDMLSEVHLKQLKERFQVDFAYEIPGVGRFRANIYKQQRGYDAVFRTIKPTPPTLADLGLPKEFEKYTEFHQGLMLFTGPAGCGKSSTMAAMADLINKRRSDHILTIEDPIEYVHESDSCNVTQREVGAQTASFPTALIAALREDPDVIVIGELRDLETISLAITAAETG